MASQDDQRRRRKSRSDASARVGRTRHGDKESLSACENWCLSLFPTRTCASRKSKSIGEPRGLFFFFVWWGDARQCRADIVAAGFFLARSVLDSQSVRDLEFSKCSLMTRRSLPATYPRRTFILTLSRRSIAVVAPGELCSWDTAR